MNTKLIIKDTQNNILQTAIFHEQETLDAFLAMIAANSTFGKAAYDEVVSPDQVIEHAAIPAVTGPAMELKSPATEFSEALYEYNANSILVPAVDAYTEIIPAVIIHHEAEYTVEITNCTEELRLQKESNDARDYLAATDYKVIKAMETGIPMNEQVKLLRAEARLKV